MVSRHSIRSVTSDVVPMDMLGDILGESRAASKERAVLTDGALDGSDFQCLLDQVAAEHNRAIAKLRTVCAENAELRLAKSSGRGEYGGAATARSSARRSTVTAAGGVGDCRFGRAGSLTIEAASKSDDELKAVPLPGTAQAEAEADLIPHDTSTRTIGVCDANLTSKDFHIKDIWLEVVEAGRLEAAITFNQSGSRRIERQDQAYNGALRHFICFPSSPWRMIWDVIGTLLISYDLFAIPLLFAFQPAETSFITWMDWFTLCYWTCDIFASLLVGYVKDGVTHMRPLEIAVRYAKTWLLVDLVVVIPDWGFTLARASTNSSRAKGSNSLKLIRIVRLCRMVRLLRLRKIRIIVQHIDELIDSEYLGIFINIAKMIMLLLVINHYISCAWYMVGTMGASVSWVTEHGFEGEDWPYQYFTSFHWGITQFTPASMHVQPQNIHERIYAIAVVVFALVGFAYVVGSITGSLTQLRSMQESMSKQFWMLKCYLKQNRVSITLASRVQRYLEHAWKSQHANLSTEKIPILAALSDQLRSELQCEIFVPQLSVHPLLNHLNTHSCMTMGRIAITAISRKVFATSDTLFIPGENATHMAFVRTGKLEYISMDVTGEPRSEFVDNTEDWIAEPVLWMTAWTHVGRLTAIMECELLLVDPKEFGDIIYKNPPAFQIVSRYAQNFAKWAKSDEGELLSDVTQGEEVGDRVKKMMDLVDEEKPVKWGKLLKQTTRLLT